MVKLWELIKELKIGEVAVSDEGRKVFKDHNRDILWHGSNEPLPLWREFLECEWEIEP